MKKLMKSAAIRSAVKNIAKEQLPDLKAMHAKYNELKAKYSKKKKDLDEFGRGCATLKSLLK